MIRRQFDGAYLLKDENPPAHTIPTLDKQGLVGTRHRLSACKYVLT